jgi:hypothetical protein
MRRHRPRYAWEPSGTERALRVAFFVVVFGAFLLLITGGTDDEHGPLPDPCYPYACHLIED